MEPEFWKERWQARQIGFNLPTPHDYLVQHGAPLWSAPQAHVLVPLCGKSVDMKFLAQQGAQVTGAELVESAAREFFEEAGVSPEVTAEGELLCCRAEGLRVRILVGDFFRLGKNAVGALTGVYDRAALVALPPTLRQRYVDHLLGLLPTGAGILLVTMVYDQTKMGGPPFSVPREEVETLYAACQSLTPLVSESALEREARFVERGLRALSEEAYWIVR